MDAVVIVDPVQYQRRGDEREDVSMPLRSLHFGPGGGGCHRALQALTGPAVVTFCSWYPRSPS